MSADNGIYILVTPIDKNGDEYRVRHLQAVENYEWGRCPIHGSDTRYGNDGREPCLECRTHSGYTADPDIHIANAREMWGNAQVHVSRATALEEAADMLATLDVCEYGISFIEIPRPFSES